jgi:putative transposase
MCSELEVSRSGYYAWPLSGPSAPARTEDMFTVMIKAIYQPARGNRGVRRAGLAALGHLLSHKRAWRLMRAAGLHGHHPKAWKLTTVHAEKSKNPFDARQNPRERTGTVLAGALRAV